MCQVVRLALAAGCLTGAGGLAAEPLLNPFNDPFVQVTAGVARCPPPSPPTYSAQQARELAHERAQRGVSCWLDGRCRLHNAYLYDVEIVPRVAQAIRYAGRYGNTSVWVLSQRRQVLLMGCVADAGQIEQLKSLAARIDDVERVDAQMMVGADGALPYRPQRP